MSTGQENAREDTAPQTSVLPVAQGAVRQTLFAEQAIVASPGPDAIELIFLRNELILPMMNAQLTQRDDGTADLAVSGFPIAGMLTDVGHVRLASEVALNLAFSIIVHHVQHHGTEPETVLSRLHERGIVAT